VAAKGREKVKKTEAELQAAYNKRVKDRNYRFEKMSPAKKRVRIAKDVIEMLDTQKLQAKTGSYLHASRISDGQYEYDYDADMYEVQYRVQSFVDPGDTRYLRQQQEAEATPVHVLLDKVESCTVCAIGSAFVASVLRANKVTMGDIGGKIGGGSTHREYLQRFFTKAQLGLIESAFERSDEYSTRVGVSAKLAGKAVEFGGETLGNDDKRLRAIFNNIIDNDGTFKP
jgi:hypothetical protein